MYLFIVWCAVVSDHIAKANSRYRTRAEVKIVSRLQFQTTLFPIVALTEDYPQKHQALQQPQIRIGEVSK